MHIHGLFNLISFNFFDGNNRIPPITVKNCWGSTVIANLLTNDYRQFLLKSGPAKKHDLAALKILFSSTYYSVDDESCSKTSLPLDKVLNIHPSNFRF